jgi:PKHD-type hydroxylase
MAAGKHMMRHDLNDPTKDDPTEVNDPAEKRITHRWAIWRDGFTGEELTGIEAHCNSTGLEPAGMLGGNDESRGRRSGVRFHKPDGLNAWFFKKLNGVVDALNAQFYGFDLNGYAHFQYTVYSGEVGGFYDWHMDLILGDQYAHFNEETRKLSLSLLLSEPDVDFTGGEFLINDGRQDTPLTIPLRKGEVAAFPSWMIHKVAPVTWGTRKSIVVWVLGPTFR